MSDETEAVEPLVNDAQTTEVPLSQQPSENEDRAARIASSNSALESDLETKEMAQMSDSSDDADNAQDSHSHADRSHTRAEKKKSVPRARRMKLSLTQIDPWSVTKVSFMLLIAAALIQLVAIIFLYYVLQAIGVFDSLTSIVSSAGLNSSGFDLSSFISLSRVISIFTIISVFEIVVGTVLAAISAFLYNIVSSLVGGIHVTLGDD
ncbi:DUF3566 domain-containing protein [Alloscardovia criceti]|uniref:DUF3566 domain-containing protein n=1 Tax=Alloscardovia criceti TaxID=356828 RepID=UPI00036AA9A4|nr:DUF3566 domain-containing protein [Alloscardovia criceti]